VKGRDELKELFRIARDMYDAASECRDAAMMAIAMRIIDLLTRIEKKKVMADGG